MKKKCKKRSPVLPLVGHRNSPAPKCTPLVEPVLCCRVVCDAQTNGVKACLHQGW